MSLLSTQEALHDQPLDRSVSRATAVVQLHDDTQQAFKQILGELQLEFLERDDQVEACLVALLAGTNVLAFGEPGTGKTDLLKALSRRFPGARLFRLLMDRQMDKAEMLGGLDLPHYQQTGEYKINTTRKLFDADLAYFDEIDKTGPGVTTPLLTAINEGEGDDGTGWRDLDLIMTMGSANAEFEAGMEAFRDRFPVATVFERLKQPDSVFALVKSQFEPRAAAAPTTLPIDELRRVIEVEVPAVQVPDSVLHALVAIREELGEESIYPSDRTIKLIGRLVQAHAWLHGRAVATEDDLVVCRHALWTRMDQRQKVAGIVLAHTGPVTRAALKLIQAVDEMTRELTDLGSNNHSDAERAEAGGRFQWELGELRKQLDKARKTAGDHDTSKLDEADAAIKEMHARILIDVLSTPEAAARRMAGLV